MNLVAIVVAGLVGASIGFALGTASLPEGAELESAVYPVGGAIVGGLVGLIGSFAISWSRADTDEDP